MIHWLLQTIEGMTGKSGCVVRPSICGDSASRNPPDDGAECDAVITGGEWDAVMLEAVK